MKYYRAFRIRQQSVPPVLYEQVCMIYPEGKAVDEFNLVARPGDETAVPTIERLVKLCQRQGLTRTRSGSEPGCYGYNVDRIYEEEDLWKAELLLVRGHPREIQLEHERDAQGRLLVIASRAKQSLKIGRIWPNDIIVSNSVRKLLESRMFIGLSFGETVLKGKSIYAAKEPFWELQSSILLPTMPNPERSFHPDGVNLEPFKGDYSRIVAMFEPPFRNSELHYRQTDLQRVGTFDMARTFEKYLYPNGSLVVSQRLFRFFLENKVPLRVEPVRIDPE